MGLPDTSFSMQRYNYISGTWIFGWDIDLYKESGPLSLAIIMGVLCPCLWVVLSLGCSKELMMVR